MNTIEDCITIFRDSFKVLNPDENSPAPCTSEILLTGVKLSLDARGCVDFLFADFKEESLEERCKRVQNFWRAKKQVFSAAVSGAGKTRLCFDLAAKEFCVYFDFNGGVGKVRQEDVNAFWTNCSQVSSTDYTLFVPYLESLILSRMILFLMLRRQTKLTFTKRSFLRFQTKSFSSSLYLRCVLMTTSLRTACFEVVKSHLAQQGIVLRFIVDEAQNLLKYPFFPSTEEPPTMCRPIGAGLLKICANAGYFCFVAGTSLRLGDFRYFVSNIGGEPSTAFLYDYDFFTPERVLKFLGQFLNLDGLDESVKRRCAEFLQGRPRFSASLANSLLTTPLQSGTLTRHCEGLFAQFRNKMVLDTDDDSSLAHSWKRLYEEQTAVEIPGIGPRTVWSISLNLLVNSLIQSKPGERYNYRFTNAAMEEIVSCGVAMFTPKGKSQGIWEPLALSAGLTVCRNQMTLGTVFQEKFFEAVSPQIAGTTFDYLIALNLFDKLRQRSLGNLLGFPGLDKIGPYTELEGILTRVSLRTFLAETEITEKYVLLPKPAAGPDVVVRNIFVSNKLTFQDTVASQECQKALRTTTPKFFYSRVKKVCREGSPSKVVCGTQMDALLAEQKVPCPIVRVRIELPAASRDYTPASLVSQGRWQMEIERKFNSRSAPFLAKIYDDPYNKDWCVYINDEQIEKLVNEAFKNNWQRDKLKRKETGSSSSSPSPSSVPLPPSPTSTKPPSNLSPSSLPPSSSPSLSPSPPSSSSSLLSSSSFK